MSCFFSPPVVYSLVPAGIPELLSRPFLHNRFHTSGEERGTTSCPLPPLHRIYIDPEACNALCESSTDFIPPLC